MIDTAFYLYYIHIVCVLGEKGVGFTDNTGTARDVFAYLYDCFTALI